MYGKLYPYSLWLKIVVHNPQLNNLLMANVQVYA
jgi:hypothetical protein